MLSAFQYFQNKGLTFSPHKRQIGELIYLLVTFNLSVIDTYHKLFSRP